MDRMIPFAYRPGNSMLHLLDARCKFFMICLISMSLVSAHFTAGFIYFMILMVFFKQISLNILATLKSLKYFLFLLFFIFLARALTEKGPVLFSFFSLSISKPGINVGALVAFKFFLVMMTGLVFTSTTRTSSVKGAAQWFLKPVPFVPEKRVAVMISLSLGFMPIILKQAGHISDAQKARCADLEKNPVKKITRLVVPLMKKIFLCADSLVLAMESRCYSDDRTDPEFFYSGKEGRFLAGSILLSICLIAL